ncbi:hypothetical protein [uncultured Roseovarius sp.]|uniref:hypothetical protein n=1 Tax=uncultured Roseovarius sp. TaxID=293344 RepID=UPI00260E17E4|nr:hypothetical protein [uncultured Roseovarius sp.]
MTRSHFLPAALAAFLLGASGSAQAQAPDTPRLVFLGADPAQSAPGPVKDGLSVLALDDLPTPNSVNEEVLAAILRSNPISTVLSSRDSTTVKSGSLHLVTALELSGGTQGVTATIRDETVPLDAFLTRLEALVGALNPAQRQIAFVHVADPQERLPAALDAVSGSFDRIGMAMTVLIVGNEAESCRNQRAPLEYAVLAGLADRVPFGDGDGATTAAEATRWISGAMTRSVKREEDCAARYSLILRTEDSDETVVARHTQGSLIPMMENAVGREEFRALFLRDTEDPDQIAAYLEDCTYCPHEEELDERLQTISDRQMALDLETEIWSSIRADDTTDRLKVYVAHCDLCQFKDEAEARIARLEAADAARADEAARFEALRAARDLNGLREWRDSCVACDQKAAAEALITEILADGRLAEETARLRDAIGMHNAEAVKTWLETCEICAERDKATAAMDRMAEAVAAARPCQVAAGLPQHGGPRLLSSIDRSKAREICSSILTEHPENPAVITVIGRIDQAAGDMDKARRAYAKGMSAARPAAFGLAAYAAFAPGDKDPDYAEAERLALAGTARGDWLSGEVLTLLYLRELIDGKDASDAFPIASADAEEGNPVAQFFMGYFHNGGIVVEQSKARAADWFSKAVEQGYLHANAFLAGILESGDTEVPADIGRAADLYWQGLIGRDDTALQRLTDQINDRPNEIVRILQNRLQDEGVFRGLVDGIPGPRTVGAVERFAALQQTNPDAE